MHIDDSPIPLGTRGPRRRPFAERFWVFVQKTETCWIWIGTKSRNGYGWIGVGGRNAPRVGAHRASWELHFGRVPDGLWVLHRCDNPPCVRPDHLFLGSAADNTRDMMAKNRRVVGQFPRGDQHWTRLHPERILRGDNHFFRKHPERVLRGDNHPLRKNPALALRGQHHPGAKLTEAQVRAILTEYATGTVSQQILAKRYRVSGSLIGAIVTRKAWCHIG